MRERHDVRCTAHADAASRLRTRQRLHVQGSASGSWCVNHYDCVRDTLEDIRLPPSGMAGHLGPGPP